MTDTTQKPVFVYYDTDAAPDDLHPSGVVAGTTFEAPTPAVARQFHPKARILRYADGGEYNHRKALAEIRTLDKETASDGTAVEPVASKPSRSRSTTSSKSKPAASSRSASSKRSGSSQTKAASTKASVAVVPEPVALSVPETVVEPVETDSTD